MKKTKIHVVPCVVIFNREGKVLLLKRARSKRNGGRWEIPGGSLRYGESPRRGALRELREETGFKLTPLDLRPVDTFGVIYPEMRVEFIIPLYTAVVDNGVDPVIRPEEHDDWGWFTIEQIKEMELRDETMKGAYLMVKAAKKLIDSLNEEKMGGSVSG
ncbi:MAG: NUDIX hydrolase [Candidatus Korarchaeota archaeon]|nr:NUDIX hydrolase [Candidatus Korarchaeota archaeon]